MSTHERLPYKIVGPATWELIRAAYLAGESAPALAERFSVGIHAIRRRATVERWTKRAYAEALEAQGPPPPPRPKPLNVAERFAANYTPPPAPPEEEHPFASLVAALKEAAQAAERGQSAEFAAQSPLETAAELERRALAQTGAALAKGRASDAKAFAALAEQMRKHAAVDAASTEALRHELTDEERVDFTHEMFAKVAYVAAAMVHAPVMAPGAFLDLIKQWRVINLGEGEEDAEIVARTIAEAQAHYLDGDWVATMPEEVQKDLQARWARYRATGAVHMTGREYLRERGMLGEED